MNISKTTSGWW
jgi:hypothetical protein